MEKILIKYSKNLKYFFISFLFASFIFFWGINFNFLQLRFLIFLLIIPIILKIDKILFKKITKWFLVAALIFIHNIVQSSIFSLNIFFEILGFFFLCIIFEVYKKYFFEKLDQIINIFLFMLFSYILLSYFSWDDYSIQVSDNCIGCFSILREFFNENSHFGLAIVPVIFYLLFLSKMNISIRIIFLFFIIILSYLNPSMTLLAGLVVTIFIVSPKFWKFKKLTVLCIFFFFYAIFSNNYFLKEKNKIIDVFKKPQNINLSSEVYLASFFVAKKAILKKPLGYGFNNYHLAFDEFIKDFKPHNKLVLVLNRKDASNNFSKIISEFGIFSFFYFYLLLSFFIRKNVDSNIRLFLIIPLIIQTFFRGAGYFNGGFLLFLIYTFLLWKEKTFLNNKFK
jgi:hypothetical protein